MSSAGSCASRLATTTAAGITGCRSAAPAGRYEAGYRD